jgi:ATP synthase protein I
LHVRHGFGPGGDSTVVHPMSEDQPPESSASSKANGSEALAFLDERLRRVRGRGKTERAAKEAGNGAVAGIGVALRIGVEMVAALAVGVGIGLLLDNWLDTMPWFLVVFFFLGAAAGILNVCRAACKMGFVAADLKDPARGADGTADNGKQDDPA